MRHVVAFVVFTHFVTCRLVPHERQWKEGDARNNCTSICKDECIHCIEPTICTEDQILCGTEHPKKHPDCPPNEVCVPAGCSCSTTVGKDGSDCVRLCDIECKEEEILCPGGYDSNECKENDFCHPRGTGNGGVLCRGFCPKECKDDEIRCPSPNEPDTNCKVPPLCIPKQTSIGNPTHVCSVQQCPIICDSSEKRCVGVIDNEGCKTADKCIPKCEACPLECESGEILCKGARDCDTGCQDPHQCRSKATDVNGEPCPDDSASHGCSIDCCEPDIVCPVATSALGCKEKETCIVRSFPLVSSFSYMYCPVTSDCPTICQPNEVLCPVDGQDEAGCEKPDICVLQERDINAQLCPVACPIECKETEVLCDGHINAVGCKLRDTCVRREIRKWGSDKGTLCPGVCPPQCKHDEILCPSQLDPCDGCPTEEVCRPKHKNINGEDCPDNSASHKCPKMCYENEVVFRGTNNQILCPAYEDALGCKPEAQCLQRSLDDNGHYCPSHSVCPVQCQKHEIECLNGVDARECKRQPSCIPKGEDKDGNMCPGFCPPICKESELHCKAAPRPNGCQGYDYCRERGTDKNHRMCPGFCPPACNEDQYLIHVGHDDVGCDLPYKCQDRANPCENSSCGDTCVVEGDMAGKCNKDGKCSFDYENLRCGVGDCEDTDKGLTDEDGDGCDFYTKNPHSCGDYDGNEGFVANQMCCACGGGKGRADTVMSPTEETTEASTGCEDTDNGLKDLMGGGCDQYYAYPEECDIFDGDGFFSNQMCCACGGGKTSVDSASGTACNDDTDCTGYAECVEGVNGGMICEDM